MNGIAVVDTETTGRDPRRDRVVEVAIITVEKGQANEWSSLVRPDPPALNAAQHVNGITRAMLESAPTFAAIADQVSERLDGRLVVAHNVLFDKAAILAEYGRAQVPAPLVRGWRCTMTAAKHQGQRHLSLRSCCARFGIPQTGAHRALADCRACLGLLSVVGATAPELFSEPRLGERSSFARYGRGSRR